VNAPAAWHPDPTGRHEHRYWDGERWTEHVADAGVAATDPLDGASTDSDAAADRDSESGGPGQTSSADDASQPGTSDEGGFTPLSPIEPTSADTTAAAPGPGGPPSYGSSPATPPSAPAGGGGYGPPNAPTAPGAGQAGFGSPYSSYPSASPVGGQPQGSNPMAVTGMILGIASIVLSWLGAISRIGGVLMLLVAITAIVLSIMGKSRANKGRRGNGMAITGIVTGIIGIIAAGLFWAGGEFWRAFSDEFSELVECIEETGDEEFCQRQFEDRILDRN
jgi:hypothetical protein